MGIRWLSQGGKVRRHFVYRLMKSLIAVLRIFNVDDEACTFTEAVNLRVGKNLNLNFSCNDVVWNLVDENLLATAAMNGAVVIWNLQRNLKSKVEFVFTTDHHHRRTVNTICFHPTEFHYLLSGSQDGTMKLFDLRKREAASTFLSKTESVSKFRLNPKLKLSFQICSRCKVFALP